MSYLVLCVSVYKLDTNSAVKPIDQPKIWICNNSRIVDIIVVANVMKLDGYHKLRGDENKPCSAPSSKPLCFVTIEINLYL
jgi:hypothetical protein